MQFQDIMALVAARMGHSEYPEFARQVWLPSKQISRAYEKHVAGFSARFGRSCRSGHPERSSQLCRTLLGMRAGRCATDRKRQAICGRLFPVSSQFLL